MCVNFIPVNHFKKSPQEVKNKELFHNFSIIENCFDKRSSCLFNIKSIVHWSVIFKVWKWLNLILTYAVYKYCKHCPHYRVVHLKWQMYKWINLYNKYRCKKTNTNYIKYFIMLRSDLTKMQSLPSIWMTLWIAQMHIQ